MTIPEHVVRQILKELVEISGRAPKLVLVRELATSDKLEQMQRVQMLEWQTTWMREIGFDRIETIAEMHEEALRRLHADFDPGPVYTRLYNARRPPTPEEFTLGMKVEVKRLRMERLPSNPPPQYDLPPRVRWSAVRSPSGIPLWSSPLPCTKPESSGDDQTESYYFGAPADGQFLGGEGKVVPKCKCPALKSPLAGKVLEEPGEPLPQIQQTDQGGTFPFQADIDGFLHADCTRISKKGGGFSFQIDIGVNSETT